MGLSIDALRAKFEQGIVDREAKDNRRSNNKPDNKSGNRANKNSKRDKLWRSVEYWEEGVSIINVQGKYVLYRMADGNFKVWYRGELILIGDNKEDGHVRVLIKEGEGISKVALNFGLRAIRGDVRGLEVSSGLLGVTNE